MTDYIETKLVEANNLYQKGKYKEALHLYLKCYDDGNLSCIARIGWIYGKGLGVNKNLEESKKWFEKANKNGDIEASIALGRIALISDNDCEAFEYFKKVSNLRLAPGIYWVGKCFDHGYCVKKNNARAFIYYTFAARKGHFLARRERAKMLMYGKIGTPIFSNLIGMIEVVLLFVDMAIAIKKNPNDSRFFA